MSTSCNFTTSIFSPSPRPLNGSRSSLYSLQRTDGLQTDEQIDGLTRLGAERASERANCALTNSFLETPYVVKPAAADIDGGDDVGKRLRVHKASAPGT